MASSSALYQPSIFELARAGNCQAIAYWMNSLLAPHGVYIHVLQTPSHRLQIIADFQKPKHKDLHGTIRDRLVRFICYRLWTLNSDVIDDVRIIGRSTDDEVILWKQTVRIITPANANRLKVDHHRQQAIRTQFQVARSIFLSGSALTGFILGYWLFYFKIPAERSLGTDPVLVVDRDRLMAQSQFRQVVDWIESDDSTLLPRFTIPEQFRGQIVYEIPVAESEKVVALTFEDGPWLDATPQLLDILKHYGVKATFFWLGESLKQFPDIAQQVVTEGHAVGNHTLTNPEDPLPPDAIAAEIEEMATLIYETTGVRTELFRPPNGLFADAFTTYAQEKGYAVTMWSVDSRDYLGSAPLLIDQVLRSTRSGSIVLLHDGGGDRSATIAALPQIITALQGQGYRFVTVPELMELKAQTWGMGQSSTPDH